MDWNELSEFMRPIWVVWLFLMFLGIIAWAFWPRRQDEMNAHAQIPLRDEDEEG